MADLRASTPLNGLPTSMLYTKQSQQALKLHTDKILNISFIINWCMDVNESICGQIPFDDKLLSLGVSGQEVFSVHECDLSSHWFADPLYIASPV